MADRNWYVICPDYVQGPFTKDRADRKAADPQMDCQHQHQVQQHDRKPVPAWQAAADDWADADA